MTALERRVDELERALRFQRRISVLAVASLACAFLLAANRQTLEPDVVQARRFEVVDARGRVMLRAGSTEAGGMLELSSTEGGLVLQQFAGPLGGQLSLNDAAGDPRVKLAATGSGGQLAMMRRHGNVGFSASVDPLASDLGLYTAQGRRVFQATNDAQGSGMLVVSDWQGRKTHEFAFAATERKPADSKTKAAAGGTPLKVGSRAGAPIPVRGTVRTKPALGSGGGSAVYNGGSARTKAPSGGAKAKAKSGGKRKGGKKGGGKRRR